MEINACLTTQEPSLGAEIVFVSPRINGSFQINGVTHGDVLGSVLGTGIVRGKVGDILLLVSGLAQLLQHQCMRAWHALQSLQTPIVAVMTVSRMVAVVTFFAICLTAHWHMCSQESGDGAQVIVSPDVADYLLSSLTKVTF